MTLPLTKLMGAALLTLSSAAVFAATGAGVPASTTPATPILTAPIQLAPKVAPAAAQYVIKPKLTAITLTPNVYAPGPDVTLNMNLTGDLKATNCKFVANVHTVVSGDNVISTQVNKFPIIVKANLPQTGLDVPIGAMSNLGKYRVDLIAAQLAGQPANPTECDGIASAEFELKRQKINTAGVTDITGIAVTTNGYDKTNKTWEVQIKGQTTTACAFRVQFKHDASGKTFESGLSTSLPTGWMFSNFPTEPPYGDYTVSVKGWNDGSQPQNSVPCIGSTSAKTYREIPADALRLNNSSVKLTVSGKKYFYPNNASVAASDLTEIEVLPYFINGFSGQQGCTYSIKVAKDGQELVLPFTSATYPSIYPAMKQKFGMTAGEYAITLASTPADYKPGVLSCLGATAHKLTVTEKPTITAVMSSFYRCDDSNCHVNLTTTFSGNSSCVYAISIQKTGHVASVFPFLIHNPGIPDVLRFNFYNGPLPPPDNVIAQLKAETYFIKVYPAGGATGCAGETSSGPLHLMQ